MRQEEIRFLQQSIEEALTEFSRRENISVSMEIISYISNILATYYRSLPYYLIDIKETNIFRLYKARGDVSLILVGFFGEWVNRKNRPLKEEDYISAGKINYRNAYYYLDQKYGDIIKEEKQKEYFSQLNEKFLFTFIDLFKEISENFEIYTDLLKRYKLEAESLSNFLDNFGSARLIEMEKLFKIK
ncbi:hypothetical protein [Persephonella sp.]